MGSPDIPKKASGEIQIVADGPTEIPPLSSMITERTAPRGF